MNNPSSFKFNNINASVWQQRTIELTFANVVLLFNEFEK